MCQSSDELFFLFVFLSDELSPSFTEGSGLLFLNSHKLSFIHNVRARADDIAGFWFARGFFLAFKQTFSFLRNICAFSSSSKIHQIGILGKFCGNFLPTANTFLSDGLQVVEHFNMILPFTRAARVIFFLHLSGNIVRQTLA